MNIFGIQNNNSNFKKGFTLIEVLVSVSLFTIVAITGITALVFGKSVYQKSQSMKTTLDSLTFIVEDISRTARLGAYYRCINLSGTPQSLTLSEESVDGTDCKGMSYEPFWNMSSPDPEDQIVYVFAPVEDTEGVTTWALFGRNVYGQQQPINPELFLTVPGSQFQRLTPKNLNIDIARSGFDIVNADGNLATQPRILIRINGKIILKNQTTEVSLQTTVSQRAIRIE